jgi:hypothetical protein
MVQQRDVEARAIIEQLEQGKLPAGVWDDSLENNNILQRDRKVYVPRCIPLYQEILKRNHDELIAGHYGVACTANVIRQKYAWNELQADVRKFISDCDSCQQHKVRRHKPHGEPTPEPTVYKARAIARTAPEQSHHDLLLLYFYCNLLILRLDQL